MFRLHCFTKSQSSAFRVWAAALAAGAVARRVPVARIAGLRAREDIVF